MKKDYYIPKGMGEEVWERRPFASKNGLFKHLPKVMGDLILVNVFDKDNEKVYEFARESSPENVISTWKLQDDQYLGSWLMEYFNENYTIQTKGF